MKRILPIFMLVLVAHPAAAEQKTVYVQTPDQAVRSAPDGTQLAIVERNVPLTMLEQKDDWVKVRLEGWIRASSLRSGESRSLSAQQKAVVPIELVEHEIVHLPASGSKLAQAQIKLTVRNNTTATIGSWRGILIVQNPLNEIVFNSAVSDDRPLAPGAKNEVSYYWEDGEDQYKKLVSAPKGTLRVSLFKVEFER